MAGVDINTQDYSFDARAVQPDEINVWKNQVGTKGVSVTGTYTAQADDGVISAEGTFTITLPPVATSTNKRLRIVNIGTGVVTIDGNASEEINGKTSITISSQYSSRVLFCDGTKWTVSGSQPKVQSNQIITVGKAGDVDFSGEDTATPIQDAIDYITDATNTKRYTILIYPGIYVENIAMEDFVALEGVGGIRGDVQIYTTSGVLITCSPNYNQIDKIFLNVEPTASGSKVIENTHGTGLVAINRCTTAMSSSTNGITGMLMDIDCEALFILRSDEQYTMSGSSVGTNTHTVFRYNNTTQLLMNTIDFRVNVSDVDDNIRIIEDNSTGFTLIDTVFLTGNALNASYSGDFRMVNGLKDGGSFNQYSDLYCFLSSAGGGIGTAIKYDTDTDDAVITSLNNSYSITGFDTNYFADMGTGDILNDKGSSITASDNTIGDGTVNFIDSQEYGQNLITGGGVFTIDSQNEWHAFSTMTGSLSSTNVDIGGGLSGAITDTADNGGILRCTSVGHGLVTGDYITLTGMGDSAHNGVSGVTVIDVDTFDADDITWNADGDTGTWNHGSHIIPLRRGAYLLSWSFSCSASGANQIFDFAAFNGTTKIDGTQLQRNFGTANAVGVVASSPIIFLEKDDHLWFAFRNTTSAGNITISEGTFNISKIS